jgi:hypothetical protein
LLAREHSRAELERKLIVAAASGNGNAGRPHLFDEDRYAAGRPISAELARVLDELESRPAE